MQDLKSHCEQQGYVLVCPVLVARSDYGSFLIGGADSRPTAHHSTPSCSA